MAGNSPDEEARWGSQWTVWRQDDNGNQYVVAHHDHREAADLQAAKMQARGHKQTYWVARRD